MNDDNTIFMVSRQAILNQIDRETKNTNPSLYDKEDKFMGFMDDENISEFGRWQWANGYNTALVTIRLFVEKMKSKEMSTIETNPINSKMTNRERFVREISNEDLAKILKDASGGDCPCQYCIETQDTCKLKPCVEGVIEWLESVN